MNKPMSTEELVKMAQEGNRQAANEVVIRMKGLVRRWVAKYNFGTATEDLIQVGLMAVALRAIPKFDVNRGFKFATYAQWWVRRDIQRLAWAGKKKEAKSLNEQLGDDSDTTPLDLLPDHKALAAFDRGEKEEDNAEAAAALKLLPGKEVKVMALRFGYSMPTSEPSPILARLQRIEAQARRGLVKEA